MRRNLSDGNSGQRERILWAERTVRPARVRGIQILKNHSRSRRFTLGSEMISNESAVPSDGLDPLKGQPLGMASILIAIPGLGTTLLAQIERRDGVCNE